MYLILSFLWTIKKDFRLKAEEHSLGKYFFLQKKTPLT
jgi:hypothetical protein